MEILQVCNLNQEPAGQEVQQIYTKHTNLFNMSDPTKTLMLAVEKVTSAPTTMLMLAVKKVISEERPP